MWNIPPAMVWSHPHAKSSAANIHDRVAILDRVIA
jgi:hypothetical protein